MRTSILSITLILSLLALSLGAGALPIYYTDRASFEAGIASEGFLPMAVESFEGLTPGQLPGDSVVMPGFTITADPLPGVPDNDTYLDVINGPDPYGNFPTDGDLYIKVVRMETLTLTFANPVNAFGVDITDWGDNRGGTLEFYNNSTNVATYDLVQADNVDHDGPGGLVPYIFFGVIDLDFDQVVFMPVDTAGTYDPAFSIDAVTYAPVPEPATMALLGMGLAGFALRRRKLVCG